MIIPFPPFAKEGFIPVPPFAKGGLGGICLLLPIQFRFSIRPNPPLQEIPPTPLFQRGAGGIFWGGRGDFLQRGERGE